MAVQQRLLTLEETAGTVLHRLGHEGRHVADRLRRPGGQVVDLVRVRIDGQQPHELLRARRQAVHADIGELVQPRPRRVQHGGRHRLVADLQRQRISGDRDGGLPGVAPQDRVQVGFDGNFDW
jgi:hypothetical protein